METTSDIQLTKPQDNSMNDEKLIISLLDDISALEEQVIPQINELSQKLPEIYSNYAETVRELVSTTLDICRDIPNMKSSTRLKIEIAGEIAARSIEAFGKAKAAYKHNQLLDKMMAVKKMIASENRERNAKALESAKIKFESSRRLFNKYNSINYPAKLKDNDQISRISAISLRILNLYRTNMFLLSMCNYLNEEYRYWSNDMQSSDLPRPDYFMINQIIIQEMFGDKKLINVLESYSKKSGQLSGADVMLMAYPQLPLIAFQKNRNRFYTLSDQSTSNTLISSNEAIRNYNHLVKQRDECQKEEPNSPIYTSGALSSLIIILLSIFYIPGVWWVKTIIGAIALIWLWSCLSSHVSKIEEIHMQDITYLDNEISNYIAGVCGLIKQPNFDYNKKSAISTFFSSFFS